MKPWTNKRAQEDVPIRMTLTEQGSAFDLTGYTVEFIFYDYQRTEIFMRSATVEDAEAGIVSYAWQSGDLDTAGRYWGAWRATRTSNSKTREFPSDQDIPIRIIDDLPADA